MYPAPLTYERLKGWVDSCPELCICFHTCPDGEYDSLVGAIIVLPLLKKYWEGVLVGKLRETDIEPAMFAGEGDVDAGLHIFHIERFDAETAGPRLPHFAEFALNDVRKLIEKKAWNILGYSGMLPPPPNTLPRTLTRDPNKPSRLLQRADGSSSEWTLSLQDTRSSLLRSPKNPLGQSR